MSVNHWAGIHRFWSRLGVPLRPNDEVVRGFAALLQNHTARVLLLGVTPELAGLGAEMEAVDKNAAMIAHVWPGDAPGRCARLGDWTALTYPAAHFSAVIGDGSLTAIRWPTDYARLFAQIARVLAPGGRFALRLFLAPERAEPIAALCETVHAGAVGSFHAFKWRLAMALAATEPEPNIAVTRILDTFNAAFPNRAALATRTGWTREAIETIDIYQGSPGAYSFPTIGALRASFTDVIDALEIVPTGTYALAERCPLAILRVRAPI